ncbi:MAG TPA: hypothetical protein PKB07_09555, partial [Flavilitoribacter sp.]|nr:hypothetical protein [Flavilitoribacter sp.]
FSLQKLVEEKSDSVIFNNPPQAQTRRRLGPLKTRKRSFSRKNAATGRICSDFVQVMVQIWFMVCLDDRVATRSGQAFKQMPACFFGIFSTAWLPTGKRFT